MFVYLLGCLDTKQHRAIADFFFNRRILLHDVGFGEVIDAVRFEEPLLNKHAGNRTGQMRFLDVDLGLDYTLCKTLGFSGVAEDKLIEEVLDGWSEQYDARFTYCDLVRDKKPIIVESEGGTRTVTTRVEHVQRCLVIH